MDFAVLKDHRVKNKEKEKGDKYLNLAREQKTEEHEVDGDTKGSLCVCNDHQRLGKGTDRTGNQKRNGDHPCYSIVEINRDTGKSPGDPKRLAVVQPPVRDH